MTNLYIMYILSVHITVRLDVPVYREQFVRSHFVALEAALLLSKRVEETKAG